MEKGFTLKDRAGLVKWILNMATENDWKIVLEYSGLNIGKMILEYATETVLPATAKHNYLEEYNLVAIINPRVTVKFVSRLIKKCAVLSIHNETEMLFLIADDFHPECFTCSLDFYVKHHQVLESEHVVY